jgi:hypothetical protein
LARFGSTPAVECIKVPGLPTAKSGHPANLKTSAMIIDVKNIKQPNQTIDYVGF